MKYKNALYRAEEARLLDAVRAIAAVTEWALMEDPSLIRLRDTRCFYVVRADLLVLPSVEGSPAGLVTAQNELRCRALVINEGRSIAGEPTLWAQLRLCAGGRIHEHKCLRLWLNEVHGLWLLTDPDMDEPEPVVFRLGPTGPVATAPPWRTDGELQAGLASAHSLLP
ncbi:MULTISPECIES: hypothetical protein [unclassified Sphingobium]|uniref:hypothetical protein n=1 Tax=unclassified Sphingobium TaxID=2611147 RepID=UPI002225B5F2|nr:MULTISPECIES: hypothetical protein [unclassified Sphingobium]MCW2411573.1 hypothetical protein [Sphingobium sp. B8D3D]MCW2416134.1 hypothetical protein [Sphingobium sp. B8D3A]